MVIWMTIYHSDTPQEQWKSIPGYEGIYEASTFGRIRTSANKLTYTERHGYRHWKQRILSGRGDNYKTGYRVVLWKDGCPKEFLVSRLVAMTWVDGYKEELTVTISTEIDTITAFKIWSGLQEEKISQRVLKLDCIALPNLLQCRI